MKSEKDKSFYNILIIVSGFFIILILLILLVYVWIPGIKDGKEKTQQGENLAASVYAGDKRDYVTEKEDEPVVTVPVENNEKIPEGNFQITMTTEWNYPDIDTPAEDSYVENAKSNSYDTRFFITLKKDEDTILYESPLLPTGSFVTKIPLKASLSPGSYDCVVTYYLYEPGSDEKVGSLRVALRININ